MIKYASKAINLLKLSIKFKKVIFKKGRIFNIFFVKIDVKFFRIPLTHFIT
jgi:hypothetical protein